MKKALLTTVAISFFLITILLACVFVHRLALPYNEDGRYFEQETMTVYKQQTNLVFGLFMTLSFGITVLTFIMMRKASVIKQSDQKQSDNRKNSKE